MFSKAQLLLVFLAAKAYGLHNHHTSAGVPGPGYSAYAAPVAPTAYPGNTGYASPPQGYTFGYDNVDEDGNRQFRSEQGNSNNMKTGSYGYRDAHGLYRQVNYIADANGFRATVNTNEPGTAPGASADVVFNAAPVIPPTPAAGAAARPGIAATAYGGRGVFNGYNNAYSGYSDNGYGPYGNAGAGYGRVGYGVYGYVPGSGASGGYGAYTPYGYGVAAYRARHYGTGSYSGPSGWVAGHLGYRRR